MRRSSTVAGILMAATSLFALAVEERRSPLDEYVGGTQYSLMMCRIKMQMTQAGGTGADADFVGCIKEGEATARANLPKALAFVKKPKAREALKNYHVVVLMALRGISPGSDELKISYSKRQQGLDDKVNEAWARFEVEQ